MLAIQEKKKGHRFIDETDNRYGRLTVLEFAGRGSHRRLKWTCICDCGNTTSVFGCNLRRGLTKSCGCLSKEMGWHVLPRGQGAFNYLYHRLKRNAKERGYKFDLTKEQVRTIVTKNCHYCGSPPKQITTYKRCYGDFLYNGIDRTNNSLGYLENNVVPCCKHCNRAKNTMSFEEFKAWLIRAYKHFIEDVAQ